LLFLFLHFAKQMTPGQNAAYDEQWAKPEQQRDKEAKYQP
jgi:hypothetical protein